MTPGTRKCREKGTRTGHVFRASLAWRAGPSLTHLKNEKPVCPVMQLWRKNKAGRPPLLLTWRHKNNQQIATRCFRKVIQTSPLFSLKENPATGQPANASLLEETAVFMSRYYSKLFATAQNIFSAPGTSVLGWQRTLSGVG